MKRANARWGVRLAVPVFLVAVASGCYPADGDEGYFDSGVEVPLEGLCVDTCNLLEQCQQCDADPSGNCYDRIECISVCDRFASHDRFACVMASGGGTCDADFEGCLSGASLTACHQACGMLEQCNSPLLDDAGNPLGVQRCVQTCEADQARAEGFNCLAGLDVCNDESINACFDGPGVDPGDDDCGRGCAALDACELCLPDGDGEDAACMTVLQCAAACRGASEALDAERARCLDQVEACSEDAVSACLEPPPDLGDDDCAKGCTALDVCDLCLPGEDDECLEPQACVEACRAEDGIDAATGRCLDQVVECAQEAIDACLGLEPVGDDPCALACQQLDTCEFCLTDEAEECYSVAECAEECRGGLLEPAAAQCLAELEACDEGPIDACFEAEGPAAPDCETYCQRSVECAELPEEEQQAAFEACTTACAGEDLPALRTCYVEAETCAAAAECPGLPDPNPDPDPDPDPNPDPDPSPDAGIPE